MGGIFGLALKSNCVEKLFYGTDYHSHLAHSFGGLAIYDNEVKGKIHDITQGQFKAKFFDDYKKLLQNVDAVIVTSPTDTHYKIVSECLLAGKHVLVEKPIATTSEQSKKLVELAQSKDLFFL